MRIGVSASESHTLNLQTQIQISPLHNKTEQKLSGFREEKRHQHFSEYLQRLEDETQRLCFLMTFPPKSELTYLKILFCFWLQ